MGFVQKSINPGGGLGHDLIELRSKAGLTLTQASSLSKVPESFIRSLEQEQWEEISDPLYFEHVFRAYLAIFQVQQNYYIQKYRDCLKITSQVRDTQDLLPRARVRWIDLAVWSRLIATIALGIFALGIGGYVFYQVRAVTAAPQLSVEQPKEGERLAIPVVNVKGKTETDATVTINGREAIVNDDGTFTLSLDIPSGPTIIVVDAKKRRGKTAEETRHVFYQRAADSMSP